LDLDGKDLLNSFRNVVATACTFTRGEKSSFAVLGSKQILDGFTGQF